MIIDEAHRLKNRNCKLLDQLKAIDMVSRRGDWLSNLPVGVVVGVANVLHTVLIDVCYSENVFSPSLSVTMDGPRVSVHF